MKKILLLCDGDHFPQGAFEFVKQLNNLDSVFVKGLFFNPFEIVELLPLSYMPGVGVFSELREKEKGVLQKTVESFKNQCESHGIRNGNVVYENNYNKDILIRESRFADFAVISEALFCADTPHQQPNYFMEETLRIAECPVMVIPENYQPVERLAIAYDGSKECMYALKQFTGLFPDLLDLPAEFVYMDTGDTEEIPEAELLSEYTSSHFEGQFTSKLHFNSRKFFTKWISDKKNVLLVSGSYSRSAVSNMIRKSFTEGVIGGQVCPVFIAHSS